MLCLYVMQSACLVKCNMFAGIVYILDTVQVYQYTFVSLYNGLVIQAEVSQYKDIYYMDTTKALFQPYQAQSLQSSLSATPKQLLRCMLRDGWTWCLSDSVELVCIEREGFKYHLDIITLTWYDLLSCYKCHGEYVATRCSFAPPKDLRSANSLWQWHKRPSHTTTTL